MAETSTATSDVTAAAAATGQDLVVDDLVKIFKSAERGAEPVYAVNHVSLTIREGQFATLLGPSGCGKTTTLNCIAGLEQPDDGRIAVGSVVLTDVGRRIILPPERRKLGMVFQSYALWPHMTVFDNLAFGLRLQKLPGAEIQRRIQEILELVGLANLQKRYPFQLSGGQQQRVALARAVVARPRVLLLDEPLSNLDAKVREQARIWLREFQQRLGITTVYVTHDQAEALAISDMVAVMSAGHLLQYAPPKEIYERPGSRFVADFIGQTSFMSAVVTGRADGLVRARVEPGATIMASASDASAALPDGASVLLAIRAERVEVLDEDDPDPADGNVVPATVRTVVYLGSSYQLVLDTASGTIRVDAPKSATVGAQVRLHLPPEAIVVLPDEGEPVPAIAPAATSGAA